MTKNLDKLQQLNKKLRCFLCKYFAKIPYSQKIKLFILK